MFSPESYTIALSLFIRALGAVYFCAFGAFFFQIKGLLGANGILPITGHLSWIKRYYPKRCYKLIPSLFWLNSSDFALMSVVTLGIFISLFLMMGVLPPLMLLLLYILYLSIVSAGQDFLAFGWEGFLLEITANAFFISLTPTAPNIFLWISLNLVLFRFHFNGGTVKLESRDPNWRNLTGVFYHYQSQPIPNAIAWYVHKLPLWFHKISTFLMLFVEIALPFGMLGPDWMRLGVFIAFVGLQLAIAFTGNFSFLNLLTIVLCLILVANTYLPFLSVPQIEPTSWPLYVICSLAGIFLLGLQFLHLWQHFVPNKLFRKWLNVFSPFHLANRYGIFAVMTTKRYEIVFEGSNDNETWWEYTFYYKPGELDKRPAQIAPYQPRLDWQAWFLPFGDPGQHPWLQHFIYNLLKGSPEVLKLLKFNPFPSSPPKFIRTSIYDYEFTSAEEKKKTGHWWKREYVGPFTLPAHLKEQ